MGNSQSSQNYQRRMENGLRTEGVTDPEVIAMYNAAARHRFQDYGADGQGGTGADLFYLTNRPVRFSTPPRMAGNDMRRADLTGRDEMDTAMIRMPPPTYLSHDNSPRRYSQVNELYSNSNYPTADLQAQRVLSRLTHI